MKIPLPHTPKARLIEIVQRRGQTLASFLEELHLGTYERVLEYCTEQHLVPVSRETFDEETAIREMHAAEAAQELRVKEELHDDMLLLAEAPDEDPLPPPLPKKKKTRNALVKTSEKPDSE